MKKTTKTTAKKVTLTDAKAAFTACMKAKKAQKGYKRAYNLFHKLWNKAIDECQNVTWDKSPIIRFFDAHEYDVEWFSDVE